MNRLAAPFTLLPLLLLATILWLGVGSCPVSAEQNGSLTIQLAQIEPERGGSLRIALFRGEQGWPKLKNAFRQQQIAANQKQLEVRFSNLPYADNYAIEVHHDENGNGKFDMRWLPYPRPKEGVGVSNNIFGFGHPDFTDARFPISQPQQTLLIEMHY